MLLFVSCLLLGQPQLMPGVYPLRNTYGWMKEPAEIPPKRKDEDGEVLIRAVQGHSMKATLGEEFRRGRGEGNRYPKTHIFKRTFYLPTIHFQGFMLVSGRISPLLNYITMRFFVQPRTRPKCIEMLVFREGKWVVSFEMCSLRTETSLQMVCRWSLGVDFLVAKKKRNIFFFKDMTQKVHIPFWKPFALPSRVLV